MKENKIKLAFINHINKIDEKGKLESYIQALTLAFVLSVLVIVSLVFDTKTFANIVSTELKEEVIRFHVLANSNSTTDQLLKENIRDVVVDYMEPMLKNSNSIEESRNIILENIVYIEMLSKQVINNWGLDYEVKVELENTQFPTIEYGEIVFPAGEYEACRILVGEAVGDNWWCVLYPPLCYVDVATGFIPLQNDEELKENLTDEQYEIIAFQSETPYKIRFKLLEIFK